MGEYKEWNYYHRTEDGKPTVSICLILNTKTNVFSRGVAICSDKDVTVKAIGRKMAKNRAYAADKEGRMIDQLSINRDEAKKWLAKVGLSSEDVYNNKGAYNVEPTEFERSLVYKNEKRS